MGCDKCGEDPYEQNTEGMFTAFDRIEVYYLAGKSGELYVGQCSVHAELPEKVKEKASELA